jgi:hypothetical protein
MTYYLENIMLKKKSFLQAVCTEACVGNSKDTSRSLNSAVSVSSDDIHVVSICILKFLTTF